jgi:hypothetical protein
VLVASAALSIAPAFAEEQPTNAAAVSAEGPFLVYRADEAVLYAPYVGGNARLMLPGGDEGAFAVHEGRSLDAILAARPDLAKTAGIAAIRAAVARKDPLRPHYAPWRLTYERGNARLESWRGSPGAWLLVRSGDKTLAYEGQDLESILSAHADVAKNPEVTSLRELVESSGRFDLDTQHEVVTPDKRVALDLHVSPGGIAATVNSPKEDGTFSVRTWRARSLDELKVDGGVLAAQCPLWFDVPPAAEAAGSPMAIAGFAVAGRTVKQGDQEVTRLEVTKVAPDGPAAKADLKVGDQVLRVNGKPVESEAQIAALMAGGSEGPARACTLEVRRGAENLTLSIALADAKAVTRPLGAVK